MNIASQVAYLKTTGLFAGLSDDLLKQIAGEMTTVALEAKSTLFHSGDAGDAVYLVMTGTLRMERDGIRLVTRGPGECVGEFALIDDEPRSADVVAETHVQMLRWDRPAFKRAFSQSPEVASGLFKILLNKLREDIGHQVETALELRRTNDHLARENRTLQLQLEPEPEVVSQSLSMKAVLDLTSRIAASSSTVLLYGQTGTGKEVMARFIHRQSPFNKGSFVPVHCAALPAALLESELFGHERGAFTGATAQRIGRFELADGGTLFLDEVGEIDPEVQVKLLRVLQDRCFQRIGGNRTVAVNVRVIAATNRNLAEAVRIGVFREDLYYRLNVIPIILPPLRERREDIPVMADYFLHMYSRKLGRRVLKISDDTMALLMAYAWPGNVRELQNLIERMVVVVGGDEVMPGHLPPEFQGIEPPALVEVGGATRNPPEKIQTLQEHERRYILDVLAHTNGMIAGPKGAAKLLGVPPSTLRSRIKKLGIK